ncbi:MAG: hypothetical protein SFZ03_00775 [Candidatus Melainabacteria bacterium]|nr:hypothetical protein [Candidatus Melainabacteria bacterium]
MPTTTPLDPHPTYVFARNNAQGKQQDLLAIPVGAIESTVQFTNLVPEHTQFVAFRPKTVLEPVVVEKRGDAFQSADGDVFALAQGPTSTSTAASEFGACVPQMQWSTTRQ